MIKRNENIIVFRHNDMDGFASAAVVMYFTGTAYEADLDKYIELTHDKESDEAKFQEVIKNADPATKIYIVDYSFTKDTYHRLEALLKKGHPIVWIDHHDSSLELIKNHPEFAPNRSDYDIKGIISKDGSGAYLAWKYFNPDKDAPEFIKLVSDYDTFTNKMPDSAFFKLGVDIYLNSKREMDKYNVFISQLRRLNYNALGHNILTTDGLNLISKGKIIKEYIDGDNNFHIHSYGYESQLEDGTKIYCINRESNSWVFCEFYEKYDAVVLYYFDGENYKYSMYSHDKVYDCGKYAESKGGGGHRGASGWQSKELMFKKIN